MRARWQRAAASDDHEEVDDAPSSIVAFFSLVAVNSSTTVPTAIVVAELLLLSFAFALLLPLLRRFRLPADLLLGTFEEEFEASKELPMLEA